MRARHSLRLVMSALLVSASVLGCAGQSPTPSPTPTPSPSPTASPSPSPTPSPTPIPTPTPTPTPTPYVIRAAAFASDHAACNTDVTFTKIDEKKGWVTLDGDFVANIRGGMVVLWCIGAKHTWMGTLTLAHYTFASDKSDPLEFEVTADGYLHIGGRGTVKEPNGTVVALE